MFSNCYCQIWSGYSIFVLRFVRKRSFVKELNIYIYIYLYIYVCVCKTCIKKYCTSFVFQLRIEQHDISGHRFSISSRYDHHTRKRRSIAVKTWMQYTVQSTYSSSIKVKFIGWKMNNKTNETMFIWRIIIKSLVLAKYFVSLQILCHAIDWLSKTMFEWLLGKNGYPLLLIESYFNWIKTWFAMDHLTKYTFVLQHGPCLQYVTLKYTS